MEFIVVPPKACDPLDLVRVLKSTLANSRGKKVAAKYEAQIQEVADLRKSISMVDVSTEVGLKALLRYFSYLKHITRHFPVNTSKFRLRTSWMESNGKKKIKCDTIAVEKAYVLFNVGASYSHIAASQDVNSPDGLVTASKNFQLAAGAFSYIEDNILPTVQEVVCIDTSRDGLRFFTQVMLGNAQLCAYLRGKKKGMKPLSLVKVAMGAIGYFGTALSILKSSSNMKKYFDKSVKHHILYLHDHLLGISHLYYGDSLTDEAVAGERVARLDLACRALGSACSYQKPGRLDLSSRGPFEEAKEKHRTSDMENMRIYYKPVPSERDLKQMEGKSIVRASTFENPHEVPDPFGDLVPEDVMAGATEFMGHVDDLYQELSQKSNQITAATQKEMQKLNLPASVDAFLSQFEGIPAGMDEKIRQLQMDGGLSKIDEKHFQLSQLRSNVSEMVDGVAAALQSEEDADMAARTQFGGVWKEVPSTSANAALRSDLAHIRNKLRESLPSDALVQTKKDESREYLALVTKSLDELVGSIPKADGLDDGDPVVRIAHSLREKCAEVERCMNFRNEILSTMESLKEDFNQQLLSVDPGSGMRTSMQDLFDTTFGHFKKDMDDHGKKEKEILVSLPAENDSFTSMAKKSSKLTEREHVFHEINLGIAAFDQMMSYLREGSKFYHSLIEMVKSLEARVRRFVADRDIVRSQKSAELLKSSGTPAGLVPPPPPQHAYGAPPGPYYYAAPPPPHQHRR
eukprot:TRINITY_DN4283_c0_g1_i1.p1 TRINITY_DN4283_c0_g1~~TRINITY_DN4283_c0_g1_i1.p1  ORF type:complete len:744 (-),score=229.15 TRINITY_DN4283_c0_g1_i1:267-2498(-)